MLLLPVAIFNEKIPLNDDELLSRISKELSVRIHKNWTVEELKLEIYTNGITNKVFSVIHTTGERLLFRVFGQDTEKIIDRAHEEENWQMLAAHGLAAPLHAKFANGLICGYLEGEPINTKNLRDSAVKMGVCRAMAKMHEIGVPADAIPCTFTKLRLFLSNIRPKYQNFMEQTYYDAYFGNVDLETEMNRSIELLKNEQVPVVFCHNDLLLNNVIYDEKKDVINFIDYEYADANYFLFDIANHFNEYAGVDNPDYSLIPNKEEKLEWLRLYYSFRTEKPSEEELSHQLHLTSLFEALSHLFWVAWALVQSQISKIDFNYLKYAHLRYQQYEQKLAEYKANSH